MATAQKNTAKPKSISPIAKKPAAKSTVEKPKAAPKKLAKKAGTTPSIVSPDQRRHYVEIAAFYIAERRNFALGNPMDDWLAAEAEIDRLLASGHIG